MPPKSRPPAPIDRPLSKAYLREFAGWSTAYPPGLSEPNSIRKMENVLVTREGAARVRPGLRSYMRTKSPWPLVGSHEIFYTEFGKAYLVAVRETVDVGTADEREIVGFRVIGDIDGSGEVVMDTLAAFGFDVPADPDVISFTSATTYVKYLQIDNKIFALSNAPEGMLMFWVGGERKAKKLQSIVRPAWNVADKLVAMHPTKAWINGSQPSSTRANLCRNPDFETNIDGWSAGTPYTSRWWSTSHSVGTHSLGMASTPERTNWAYSPLHDVASTGTTGWAGIQAVLSVSGSSMRVTTTLGKYGYARSNAWPAPAGAQMRFAFQLTGSANAKKLLAWMEFYDSAGKRITTQRVIDSTSLAAGLRSTGLFTVPTNAKTMRVLIGGEPTSTAVSARVDVKELMLAQYPSGAGIFVAGDGGADYYWEGTPNDSRSLYHPAKRIQVDFYPVPVTPGAHTVSADVWATAGETVEIWAGAHDANGTLVLAQSSSMAGTSGWNRMSVSITVPANATRLSMSVVAPTADRPSRVYVDAALMERAASAGTYFSGATPNVGTTKRRWDATPHGSISYEEVFNPVLPVSRVPADGDLVSSNGTKNRHSFSFFYTISNELGESAASQVTTIKGQRAWTAWQWLNTAGADTSDPELCDDQITVTMPQEVFDLAVASGATKWTAYYFYQGPNDAPSVTATRFAEVDLSNEPTHAQHGYTRLTPQMARLGVGDPLIPSESTLVNASDPVKGSQGIVAADRLILVGNPADPARITWSSGAPGDYHNFSPLLGGGTKQLTSGNLYVTGTVKLWQNPQSVDTLTILNAGDDGRSNAYYMQPAQITSLSESISVMGFEEVTAMMGTVSPYGCEVVSNGLYRPLFHGLFKSTANNYNITTKSVSDSIQNMWRTLQEPHHIVSAQLDSRIYFLVHNLLGETLLPNCWGNEVWVIDLAATTPTWSRWTVQGASLRAMDVDSVVMMSVVQPDGIFVFHEDRYTDERFDPDTGVLETVNIKWYLETNTQGANRAHDAWCNLQQANAQVGNLLGQIRYGIRGQDVNGQHIELEKVLVSEAPPPNTVTDDAIIDGFVMPTLNPTEREDYLLVRKIMKEWVFFAGSVDDVVTGGEMDDVVPRFGGGQINAVQYRYTPATVNVGYEYGSVETFEYGASALAGATTDSGTPQPYVDLTRA